MQTKQQICATELYADQQVATYLQHAAQLPLQLCLLLPLLSCLCCHVEGVGDLVQEHWRQLAHCVQCVRAGSPNLHSVKAICVTVSWG